MDKVPEHFGRPTKQGIDVNISFTSFKFHVARNTRTYRVSPKKGDLGDDVGFCCRACRGYRVHCRDAENVFYRTQTYHVILYEVL